MEKRWVVREKGDIAVVKQLAGALGVSECLANLMVQRNITSSSEADAFFNVTNISTHKIKFKWTAGAGSILIGNTDRNMTVFIFIRIGDAV